MSPPIVMRVASAGSPDIIALIKSSHDDVEIFSTDKKVIHITFYSTKTTLLLIVYRLVKFQYEPG